MYPINERALTELCGAALPLAILLLENDEDRRLMADMYDQYHELMFVAAARFFGGHQEDMEEALEASVVRMCKYFYKLKAVSCKKRPSYIVQLVSNVCRDMLRARRRERARRDFYADAETMKSIPDAADLYTIVFDRADALALLDSFETLSARDKDMIAMRHIDGMTIDEIAAALDISKNAAQSALSRAKHRLEAAAAGRKKGQLDEEA